LVIGDVGAAYSFLSFWFSADEDFMTPARRRIDAGPRPKREPISSFL
jgi:hypothetical protein